MNRLVQGLIVTFLLVAFVGSAFAALEGEKWNREIQPAKVKVTKGSPSLVPKGTIDYLRYPIPETGLVNFGVWPEDALYQYYIPPADGEMQEIFFRLADVTGVPNGNESFTVSIWGTSYLTWDMGSYAHKDNVGIGYYEDTEGDYEWQGTNWVNLLPDFTPGDPLTEKIWPLYVDAVTVTIPSEAESDDTVSLALTGEGLYPTMSAGVPFAIVIEILGENAIDPDGRIGFMSGDIQPYEYYPGIKFYDEFSNAGIGKYGWFIRQYIWDWVVKVNLTGDRAPIIEHTPLITTTSTQGRQVVATITDDNPSGGNAGVASAEVVYSVNEGTEQHVTMTKGSGNEYTATIPGQTPGSVITYKITAKDVLGNVGETPYYEYFIFLPENPVLVLNNSGYDMAWFAAYVWPGVSLPYDVWSYGDAEIDLLNSYNFVVDLAGHSTATYDALKTWADAGNKNYLGFGDELFGYPYGWPASPMTLADGTFFKDVMGVATYLADINSTDYAMGKSILEPIEGDVVTGPLYDELSGTNAVLYYWPGAITGNYNWFDGFEKTNNAVLSMIGYAEDNVTPYHVGILNETANGTKSAFYGFDPMAMNALSDTIDWWYPDYLAAVVFQNYFVQDVVVRFQVDMGIEIVKASFNPATDVVDVRGSFNGWAHVDEDVLAKDPTNDDLYLLDRTFTGVGAGQREEYKFVHNGGGVDNWESVDNRVLIFDGSSAIELPHVFFSDVSWDDITNQDITLIFKVDAYPLKTALNNGFDIIDVQSESDTIFSYSEVTFIGVNGYFNGWPWANIPDENKMYDNGQGEDQVAGDDIFSGSVIYPTYSAKDLIYKYGANGFDNEAGFAQNHSAYVDDSNPVFELDMDCYGMQNSDPRLPWGQGVDSLDVYDCTWWVKVDEEIAGIPEIFELRQNYPNPFNPSTTIEFSIPERSDVTMTIYNILGQAVRTFHVGTQNTGTYRIIWDGTNDFGMTVSTGIYFYTVKAGNHSATKKMVYMK
ncbi:MAG: T9SS type A sorting domain-containing protein [Candidatus Marinimicrobia bacterium]|nr:T9SS type A sorting domain-containing protein [Candidatus Neomarinimicrobiota bacterium]